MGTLFKAGEFISVDIGQLFEEAVNEFVGSGTDAHKLVSACIKAALSCEIMFKLILNKICPALLLDSGKGNYTYQIAKIFKLESMMQDPKILENQKLWTAGLGEMVKRVGLFVDIKTVQKHLEELANLRNSMVHALPDNIDIQKLNVLLSLHIFPFLREKIKENNLSNRAILKDNSKWDEIKRIGDSSEDALFKELRKKILEFREKANRLDKARVEELLKIKPIKTSTETALCENLLCPACVHEALDLFLDVDFDWNPDGILPNAFIFMRCRVCEIYFDEDEKDYISHYIDKLDIAAKLKPSWSKIPPQDYYDYI